MFEYQDND